MQAWRIMLGPFLIWAAHFVGLYALASLEAVGDPSQAARWRLIGLMLSGACVLALGLGSLWILRRPAVTGLQRRLGLVGGMLAGVAVVWQSLPLVVSAVAAS
jgi:hypothetical protein